MEPRQLQLRYRSYDAGTYDDARDEMVGQFRSESIVRQPVRVNALFEQGRGEFPNGVMTADKDDPTGLQHSNAVGCRRKRSRRIIEVAWIDGCRGRHVYQRIRGEFTVRERSQVVFVPNRLIV